MYSLLLLDSHVDQRNWPLRSPPWHWVVLETNSMLPPSPLSSTPLTTLTYPMRCLAPVIMIQLLMCAFPGLCSADLAGLIDSTLSLMLFTIPIHTRMHIRESSELFITSSHGNVRVWHASSSKELLRITIPNILCNAVEISPDGGAIITGRLIVWSD